MMVYPEMLTAVARQHVDQLIEEASRYRLSASLRKGRRQLWPESAPDAAHGPRPKTPAHVKESRPQITTSETVSPASRVAACDAQTGTSRAVEPAGTARAR
jgi:hypothetical protein